MDNREFDELAGRIEGIGRVVLLLIADLENRELLNGERFARSLREMAMALHFEQAHLEATRRTLLETAAVLESAEGMRR